MNNSLTVTFDDQNGTSTAFDEGKSFHLSTRVVLIIGVSVPGEIPGRLTESNRVPDQITADEHVDSLCG